MRIETSVASPLTRKKIPKNIVLLIMDFQQRIPYLWHSFNSLDGTGNGLKAQIKVSFGGSIFDFTSLLTLIIVHFD